MGDGLEVVWCYVKEATELPSVHSLIVDACAQANIILDDGTIPSGDDKPHGFTTFSTQSIILC